MEMSKWIERLLIAGVTYVFGAYVGYRAGWHDALNAFEKDYVEPLLKKLGISKTDTIGDDARPEPDAPAAD